MHAVSDNFGLIEYVVELGISYDVIGVGIIMRVVVMSVASDMTEFRSSLVGIEAT